MYDEDATAVDAVSQERAGLLSRTLRWGLVSLPVAAIAYTLLFAFPGLGSSLEVLGGINPWLVLLAVALEVGAMLTLTEVYRASLRAVGSDLPYGSGLNVTMSAFTVSRVIPGGGAAGGVVAARRMMHFGVPTAVATTAVVLMGTNAMIALAALVSVGSVLSVFSADLPVAYVVLTAVLGGILAATVGLLLVVLRSAGARRWVLDTAETLLRPFPVDVSGWGQALDELASDPPDRAGLAAIVGWSAVNWMFDIAVVWLVFWDIGATLDPGVLLVGYGMANLAAAVPITPGGLGLVEAGMAGTYAAFGVDASTAVAGVLAYRVLSFWLPVLAGVPAYLRAPEPDAETG